MHTTFLGPYGATFSHDAYVKLSAIYGALPTAEHNYVHSPANGVVLEIALRYRNCYGALAMETKAGGRVAEPTEAFIKLLARECPIHVIGALSMNIDFCLMGNALDGSRKILAHPKAFEACRKSILIGDFSTMETSSNGEAARLVAQDPSYANCLALAPASAAQKYGLRIFNPDFRGKSTEKAMTTFFLIGPKNHPAKIGEKNRALIVYRVPHIPGSLVHSLLPFHEQGLNLIQIHSVHAGEGEYHFAIEIEVANDRIPAYELAVEQFARCVDTHLCFGPFEVLSE